MERFIRGLHALIPERMSYSTANATGVMEQLQNARLTIGRWGASITSHFPTTRIL